MNTTLVRGVTIRSKNVGSKYKVPQPFSKTNHSFNSISNYSFAGKSITSRSLKDSGHRTSDSIEKSTSDVRYSNINNLNNSNRMLKVISTRKSPNSRIFNSSVSINRKNASVFNEKFFKYVRQNFNTNTSLQNTSTYQDRLNKSYDEMGGNATRRKLK